MIEIKSENQKLILHLIRSNKEISGAELSRITNQRRSTLAYVLKSLEDMGLISISRIGESTKSGGKPPTLWKLVDNAGYILGLEVTPSEIRTVITDFSSNIIYRDIHQFNDIFSGGSVDKLADFIKSRVEALNLNMDDFIGIGLAIPGMVDRDKGSGIYYTKNGIFNIEIKKKLRNLLGVDVELINDANAGALGEKWFSNRPDDLNNMIFLSINEDHAGIGAGFILNGQLYSGFNGSAGEFIPFGMKLDTLFEKALADSGSVDVNFDDFNTISKVVVKYKEKSEEAKVILNYISKLLAVEIARLVTLLNPNHIIIGGDFSITEDFLIKKLDREIENIYKKHFPMGISHPHLSFSKQGIFSGAMGATALYVDMIFNPKTK